MRKKMWCIYTVEYYSATRKKGILPFGTTWMDLEDISLNESDGERQIPLVSLVCGTYYKKAKLAQIVSKTVVSMG